MLPESMTDVQYRWLLRLLRPRQVAKRRQAHYLILEHFGVSKLDEVSCDQASQWIQELCRARRSLE